jgi:hypothetical protein
MMMTEPSVYTITPNITGTSGIMPNGLKPRNVAEAAVVGLIMGSLTLWAAPMLFSKVICGAMFVFLCLIPAILAITGLYLLLDSSTSTSLSKSILRSAVYQL